MPNAPSDIKPTSCLLLACNIGHLWSFKTPPSIAGNLQKVSRESLHIYIIDWINFYNHRRKHSTLGYLSPMAFEKNWLASQQRLAA